MKTENRSRVAIVTESDRGSLRLAKASPFVFITLYIFVFKVLTARARASLPAACIVLGVKFFFFVLHKYTYYLSANV